MIAADGWLLDAESLRTEEAALTGDKGPVVKAPAISLSEAVRANAAVDNHASKVFIGTTVTSGCGHAVVTATGIRTLIGQRAKMSQAARRVEIRKTDVSSVERRVDSRG